jgi:hypothetical protein
MLPTAVTTLQTRIIEDMTVCDRAESHHRRSVRDAQGKIIAEPLQIFRTVEAELVHSSILSSTSRSRPCRRRSSVLLTDRPPISLRSSDVSFRQHLPIDLSRETTVHSGPGLNPGARPPGPLAASARRSCTTLMYSYKPLYLSYQRRPVYEFGAPRKVC